MCKKRRPHPSPPPKAPKQRAAAQKAREIVLRANSRGGNAGLNVGVVECGHEGLEGDAATLLLGQYLRQQHAFNTLEQQRRV